MALFNTFVVRLVTLCTLKKTVSLQIVTDSLNQRNLILYNILIIHKFTIEKLVALFY